MAALILILAGAMAGLEVVAIRRIHQRSLRDACIVEPIFTSSSIEDLLAETAGELTALLDLRACWFEPFPFDALLPRIEPGRIVLPTPEPGVAPCSDVGVELPVRLDGLNLGRFVLQPYAPTLGVDFAPSARDRALVIAGRISAPLATALIRS